MCTLLVWKHCHPSYSLIVAANRDEFLDRPTSGPTRLFDDPIVVGGRDDLAGGTWLALSDRGLVVALTNRKGAGKHDPAKRSRGRLVLEFARAGSLDDIATALRSLDARAYNPFVLLASDARRGIVAHGGDAGLDLVDLSDGVHAVTNWDLDAKEPAEAVRSLTLAQGFDPAELAADELASRLRGVLADHGDPISGAEGCCVHRWERRYGTRSSSIVLLGERADARLFHLEGHPCSERYADFSSLLWGEATTAARVEPGYHGRAES